MRITGVPGTLPPRADANQQRDKAKQSASENVVTPIDSPVSATPSSNHADWRYAHPAGQLSRRAAHAILTYERTSLVTSEDSSVEAHWVGLDTFV